MQPLRLLISNPPRSSRKARPARKGKRRTLSAAQRRAAIANLSKARSPARRRARRLSSERGGPTMAKSRTRRRRASRRKFRLHTNPPRRSGGGGGSGGFLGKVSPPGALALVGGAAAGFAAAGFAPALAAKVLPASLTNNQIFGPLSSLAIGGLGYMALRQSSPRLAQGVFIGAGVAAIAPFVVQLVQGIRMGSPAGGGGGDVYVPGSGDPIALASVRAAQSRLAGFGEVGGVRYGIRGMRRGGGKSPAIAFKR